MDDKYLFWLVIAVIVFAAVMILVPIYWFMVL